LRDAYEEVRGAGAEVVAVGTGNASFARSFLDDYRIPYPVLIDEDARAARAAAIGRMSFTGMFHPASYPGTLRAWREGHRIGASGKRVTQLGVTFVVGPGSALLFEHRNVHGADHPSLERMLSALRA
jgi:peroxiredoxin